MTGAGEPTGRLGAPVDSLNGRRQRRRAVVVALLCPVAGATSALLASSPAAAHGARLGDLRVEHPYATPTPPGARTGAVYFRRLENRGRRPDRLLGATTSVADSVEIHRSLVEADVMRMRPIDALDLPPGSRISVRHGGDIHLMLVGLKAPLADGDRFRMTLRFEQAGEVDVSVWVQTPRAGVSGADGGHDHQGH